MERYFDLKYIYDSLNTDNLYSCIFSNDANNALLRLCINKPTIPPNYAHFYTNLKSVLIKDFKDICKDHETHISDTILKGLSDFREKFDSEKSYFYLFSDIISEKIGEKLETHEDFIKYVKEKLFLPDNYLPGFMFLISLRIEQLHFISTEFSLETINFLLKYERDSSSINVRSLYFHREKRIIYMLFSDNTIFSYDIETEEYFRLPCVVKALDDSKIFVFDQNLFMINQSESLIHVFDILKGGEQQPIKFESINIPTCDILEVSSLDSVISFLAKTGSSLVYIVYEGGLRSNQQPTIKKLCDIKGEIINHYFYNDNIYIYTDHSELLEIAGDACSMSSAFPLFSRIPFIYCNYFYTFSKTRDDYPNLVIGTVVPKTLSTYVTSGESSYVASLFETSLYTMHNFCIAYIEHLLGLHDHGFLLDMFSFSNNTLNACVNMLQNHNDIKDKCKDVFISTMLLLGLTNYHIMVLEGKKHLLESVKSFINVFKDMLRKYSKYFAVRDCIIYYYLLIPEDFFDYELYYILRENIQPYHIQLFKKLKIEKSWQSLILYRHPLYYEELSEKSIETMVIKFLICAKYGVIYTLVQLIRDSLKLFSELREENYVNRILVEFLKLCAFMTENRILAYTIFDSLLKYDISSRLNKQNYLVLSTTSQAKFSQILAINQIETVFDVPTCCSISLQYYLKNNDIPLITVNNQVLELSPIIVGKGRVVITMEQCDFKNTPIMFIKVDSALPDDVPVVEPDTLKNIFFIKTISDTYNMVFTSKSDLVQKLFETHFIVKEKPELTSFNFTVKPKDRLVVNRYSDLFKKIFISASMAIEDRDKYASEIYDFSVSKLKGILHHKTLVNNYNCDFLPYEEVYDQMFDFIKTLKLTGTSGLNTLRLISDFDIFILHRCNLYVNSFVETTDASYHKMLFLDLFTKNYFIERRNVSNNEIGETVLDKLKNIGESLISCTDIDSESLRHEVITIRQNSESFQDTFIKILEEYDFDSSVFIGLMNAIGQSFIPFSVTKIMHNQLDEKIESYAFDCVPCFDVEPPIFFVGEKARNRVNALLSEIYETIVNERPISDRYAVLCISFMLYLPVFLQNRDNCINFNYSILQNMFVSDTIKPNIEEIFSLINVNTEHIRMHSDLKDKKAQRNTSLIALTSGVATENEIKGESGYYSFFIGDHKIKPGEKCTIKIDQNSSKSNIYFGFVDEKIYTHTPLAFMGFHSLTNMFISPYHFPKPCTLGKSFEISLERPYITFTSYDQSYKFHVGSFLESVRICVVMANSDDTVKYQIKYEQNDKSYTYNELVPFPSLNSIVERFDRTEPEDWTILNFSHSFPKIFVGTFAIYRNKHTVTVCDIKQSEYYVNRNDGYQNEVSNVFELSTINDTFSRVISRNKLLNKKCSIMDAIKVKRFLRKSILINTSALSRFALLSFINTMERVDLIDSVVIATAFTYNDFQIMKPSMQIAGIGMTYRHSLSKLIKANLNTIKEKIFDVDFKKEIGPMSISELINSNPTPATSRYKDIFCYVPIEGGVIDVMIKCGDLFIHHTAINIGYCKYARYVNVAGVLRSLGADQSIFRYLLDSDNILVRNLSLFTHHLMEQYNDVDTLKYVGETPYIPIMTFNKNCNLCVFEQFIRQVTTPFHIGFFIEGFKSNLEGAIDMSGIFRDMLSEITTEISSPHNTNFTHPTYEISNNAHPAYIFNLGIFIAICLAKNCPQLFKFSDEVYKMLNGDIPIDSYWKYKFKRGFNLVIPNYYGDFIKYDSLREKVNSSIKINADTLKHFCKNKNDAKLDLLWNVLKEWDSFKVSKFLRFATGSSSIPNSQTEYYWSVHFTDRRCLPNSKTCSKLLILYSDYLKKDELENDLEEAISCHGIEDM